MSQDGKPIQVNNAVLQSAAAQNAAGMLGIANTCCTFKIGRMIITELRNSALTRVLILGNSVTVMSPEGKPIQINTAALQSAVAQNTTGILGKQYKRQFIFSRIVNRIIIDNDI